LVYSEKVLKKLNVDYFEIRKKEDLNKPMDGLIIPGGESTTIPTIASPKSSLISAKILGSL